MESGRTALLEENRSAARSANPVRAERGCESRSPTSPHQAGACRWDPLPPAFSSAGEAASLGEGARVTGCGAVAEMAAAERVGVGATGIKRRGSFDPLDGACCIGRCGMRPMEN